MIGVDNLKDSVLPIDASQDQSSSGPGGRSKDPKVTQYDITIRLVNLRVGHEGEAKTPKSYDI